MTLLLKYFCLVSIILYCNISGIAQQVYTINQISDDAKQVGPHSTISGSLIIGKSKVNNIPTKAITGVRFQNIQLSNEAIVDSAFIQFSCKEHNDLIHLINIFGEDNSTPMTYENSLYGDIDNREKTQNLVYWQLTGVCEDKYRGPLIRTPDISDVIHEIISRSDWVYSNPMAFIFEPAIDSLEEPTTLYGFGVQEGSEEAPELLIYTSYINATPQLKHGFLQVKLLGNGSVNTQIQIDTDQPAILLVEIISLTGQQISKKNYQLGTGIHSIPLPSTSLHTNGMYFIRISTPGQWPEVLKWIKS